MTFGGSSFGNSPLGSTPEPDEFEKQSDEAKNRDYRELYEKVDDLEKQLKDNSTAAENWRRRSWLWRIISFTSGLVVGFIM